MSHQVSLAKGTPGSVAYQRRQRQDDGAVEGGDDEHDALRFVSVLRAHGPEAKVELGFLGRSPFLDPVVRFRDVEVYGGEVEAVVLSAYNGTHGIVSVHSWLKYAQLGLEERTSQVLLQRLFEALFVVLDQVSDLRDLLLPESDGLGFPRLVRLSRTSVDLLEGRKSESQRSNGHGHDVYVQKRLEARVHLGNLV